MGPGKSEIPSYNPNHNHFRAIANGQVELLPLFSNALRCGLASQIQMGLGVLD
jgi:hypothetical protein